MKNPKEKSASLNLNSLIKIVLLLGFSAFFIMITINGDYTRYVHPRIVPYMIFASAVMILIAILMLKQLFHASNCHQNNASLIFYAVPLIMAFAIPAASFGTDAVTNQSLSISASTADDSSEAESTETETQDSQQFQLMNTTEIPSEGVITLDEQNYYTYLNEIFNRMDEFVGREIEFVGFVYKDEESFSENEFVPARMVMTCCAADMAVVGFLAYYDGASELEENSWVKIHGTIEVIDHTSGRMPRIIVTSLEQTEQPEQDYIYPY